jgi:exosome complex RNA-binding protein Rrp42 (RNase PH superfamily)
LIDLGSREDRRKIQQSRPIKAIFRNNSVVVSAGQTIIIAHIETKIERVTFSPISNSYGEELISKNYLILGVKVHSGHSNKHHR